MTEITPRLSLPLLQAGQAQKEALHNDAITMLDAIVAGVVETVGDDHPPASPAPGQAWIIGPTPNGDWTGHPRAVAIWTAGGWRFAAPAEGMSFRLRTSGIRIERGGAAWIIGALAASALIVNGNQVVGERLSGISAPDGGATIDVEARRAIQSMLVALRTHGLIAL